MIDLSKPVDASFELNNICNLMCPQCARNEIRDGVLQKNPNTSGNPLPTLDSHQMSLEDFKTSFVWLMIMKKLIFLNNFFGFGHFFIHQI